MNYHDRLNGPLGSGRALTLHFFRALPLPACFTTELCTVEASLFANLNCIRHGRNATYERGLTKNDLITSVFFFSTSL